MMRTALSLNHFLDRAGWYHADVEILSRMPDKSLHRHTFRDFHRRALALAEVLVAAGVQPGDRVATFSWNHYAHLECYFGIPAAGAVMHNLNLRLFPHNLAFIVNRAKDRILIVDDVLLPLLAQFSKDVEFERIIVVPLIGKPVSTRYDDHEELLRRAGGRWPSLCCGPACGPPPRRSSSTFRARSRSGRCRMPTSLLRRSPARPRASS